MSKSILSNERCCYICETPINLHKHHIFEGTGRRKLSEKYGCWCFLCANHHNMSDMGIHFNYFLDIKLKQEAQHRFNEVYSDLNFLQIFGKNYL